MIRKEEVYKIGRIGKTHGVRGEVSFLFDDDVFDRTDADYLVLAVDGILVPFFIEEYRFRSETTAIVKLEDVDTQERARDLTGCDVFFPLSMVPADDEELSMAALVGFDLIEAATGNSVGHIAAINDQTANILFELDNGRLVPAADELVTDIDMKARRISMNLPEGLFDL